MPKKSKLTTQQIIDEVVTIAGAPTHKEKHLRQDGWLTIDEFVDQLVPGLKEYLKGNWGFRGATDLHHPVDLFTTASIYMDIACHVANDFIHCHHDEEY